MLRIVFHRKNKMLLSLFKNKRVCDLLEKNYRIVCSAKNEVSENTKRLSQISTILIYLIFS